MMQLSNEQLDAIDAVDAGHNVFLTGIAGSGKSELIKHHLFKSRNGVYITSSTGFTATALGGSTIHSYAGIGYGDKPAKQIAARISPSAKERIERTTKLVIDEVSMLSDKVFDCLSEVMCIVRKCPDKPFGGVQVIVTGDLLQLPPVGSNTKLPTMSDAWQRARFHVVILKTSFRQIGDQAYAQFLSRLRVDAITDEDIEKIITPCMNRKFTKGEPIRLYPTRKDVKHENEQRLNMLTTPDKTFHAIDSGDEKLLDTCLAEKTLVLREGCQVMLLRNLNVANGLANGTQGVVVGFDLIGFPLVEFGQSTDPIVIEPVPFDILLGNDNIAASRKQIPLTLAYAITIHKAQGMTLDRVETRLSEVFEAGMMYVLFSRVRNSESLSILDDKFPRHKIRVHYHAQRYYERLEEEESTNKRTKLQ